MTGHGVLIESFGQTGDPDYAAEIARNRAVYEANGLSAILFTPDQFRGDRPGQLLAQCSRRCPTASSATFPP